VYTVHVRCQGNCEHVSCDMSLKIKRSSHGSTARSSIRRSIRKKLKKNTHERLKDPTKFDAPDSDEEAWLDELFIKNAKITEITRRVKNNMLRTREYIYQINVQWNIAKTTIIYRSYDNFFDMQMQLLDHFGEDPNGRDRTVPFLPGKQIWRIGTRTLAKNRQPKIQGYIDELLDLPYRISRCNEVLNFFRFRDSDPKQVMVNIPDNLMYNPPPRVGFLRSSIRRSFRKVRTKMTRTRSLRSMTDEEKRREDNQNYDIEPTTTTEPKVPKVKVKVDHMAMFLQVTRSLGPTGLLPPDLYDTHRWDGGNLSGQYY